VPPEVQHIINRRESDVARKISEQDEVRLVGKGFMEAANEFAPVVQARGGNPVGLFREFLGILSQIHNSDPASRAALFQRLAANNGVDLRAFGTQPQQPGASGQPNLPSQPQIPLQTLIAQTVQQQFEARQAQEARAREAQEMQATANEIETFRGTLNEQGQPAYPYFDHVTSLMAAILSNGGAQTLPEAYQLAVRAHPETSKLIAQAEQVALAKKAEDKRRLEAKRRAGGSLRGGPGNAAPANGKDRSIRDELRAAFEEARARV
jgi:hypothetical protein